MHWPITALKAPIGEVNKFDNLRETLGPCFPVDATQTSLSVSVLF